MTVSEKTNGSQTAVISSEHTLATITDPGTYQLNVDLANMAKNDVLVLRAYGKARSSDTERLRYIYTLSNDQGLDHFDSIPVVTPHYVRFSLQQTDGTGRDFPWSVYQL